MPNDFVQIDRFDNTNPFSGELLTGISLLNQAQEVLIRIQQKGAHLNTGGSFAAFEEAYGVPTGQGQFVYEAVDGTVKTLAGTLQSAQAQALINRVG